MIVASGIAMQLGAKPLFENVTVKLGVGNRYGLIGARRSNKKAQGFEVPGLQPPSQTRESRPATQIL
jgi:hypothetical protein